MLREKYSSLAGVLIVFIIVYRRELLLYAKDQRWAIQGLLLFEKYDAERRKPWKIALIYDVKRHA